MYRIGGRLGSQDASSGGVDRWDTTLEDAGILTCGRETGRGTLLGGQFDWGGRLQKSNGGAQRFAQHGRKPCQRV